MGTLKSFLTGTKTMTATTDSTTLGTITGRIKQITIKPSGTSTDFKISYTINGVTHYILGGAAATVTVVTAGAVFYPVEVRCLANGTDIATAANIHTEISLVDATLDIAVSNGASAETYAVEVVVEE